MPATVTRAPPRVVGRGSDGACSVAFARSVPKIVARLPGTTAGANRAPSVTPFGTRICGALPDGGVTPAGCARVKTDPFTVIWPVRSAPVFRSAAYWTLPGPVRLAPAVIFSQGTELTAVQGHDESVATVNDPLPPAAATEALAGFK